MVLFIIEHTMVANECNTIIYDYHTGQRVTMVKNIKTSINPQIINTHTPKKKENSYDNNIHTNTNT